MRPGLHVVAEPGRPARTAPHALVGVSAVSLRTAQGMLGWLLWNEKDMLRRYRRYYGFALLGLAMVQTAFGLGLALEYL